MSQKTFDAFEIPEQPPILKLGHCAQVVGCERFQTEYFSALAARLRFSKDYWTHHFEQ